LRDEITVVRERVQPIPIAFLRVESGYNWEVNLTTVGVPEIEINGMMLFDGLSRPEPPMPGGNIDATPQPR
jgi:hypothetical protein